MLLFKQGDNNWTICTLDKVEKKIVRNEGKKPKLGALQVPFC